MRFVWLISCVPCCAALLASGCSHSAPAHSELRFSTPNDPKTFDPLHVSEQNSELIRFLTGGSLVRINRVTDVVEPELAQSWSLSPDGTAITFQLRPNLKFSDGTPLDAHDVARTLKTELDPKEASPKGDTFHSENGDPDVVVNSPLSVTVRYPAPKPNLDRLFDAFTVVPAKPAKIPASAGPYYVSEYKPGDHILLSGQPYFWKRPQIETIRIDIQPNRDIELERFLRGEYQIVGRLDPVSFDRVKKEQPQAARNLGPSLDSEFLWFGLKPSNTVPEWKLAWWKSAAFRRAIGSAIRRDDIVKIVYRGYAHPAPGTISPANKFWFNAALKPPVYDAAQSLAALKGEGFSLLNGVLHDKSGHEVEFSIITNSGNRTREAMAAVIQDDLKAIGIRVNIVTLDLNSVIDRILSGNYEACLFGFTSVEISPNETLNVWLSSGAQHAWWPMQKTPVTPWEARIDELALTQASEPSREKRKQAMDELQQIMADQEPIVYLVNPDVLAAISPSLKGVEPVAAPPQILWNIESLHF